jgi:uncharacterized protein YdeI (YjbR/CyaY-like superfamily)
MDLSPPGTKNPDLWLESRPEFSRPICAQLREWFQRWEPDLTESIKWNVLCYTGRKLVCGISGCKKHVGIVFFRGTELSDPAGLFSGGENNTSIQNIRVTSLENFPREALRKLLRAAVNLDLDPDRLPPPPRKREPLPVPDDLAAALVKNKKAAAAFNAFARTYRHEYITWVTSAKREETRQRRLAETIAALEQGRKWIDQKK